MLNALKIITIFTLFISCNLGLPAKLKTKLEDSSKNTLDQLDGIKNEYGIDLDSSKTDTGPKGVGDVKIKDAKLKAIEVAEEFLSTVIETIDELGKKGTSKQFSEIFESVLKVAASLEPLGVQGATNTVNVAAGKKVADTYEKITNVHEKLYEKLQNVKLKQQEADKQKKDKEKKSMKQK
ncbi:DbpA/DbpB family decorin-binding adhesin [Candidatus Borreliella tachyglossi]|uniref:DbpA/DbpB family decorin-binding adhesin n=1 Tax=Candidatus Borreliella tachyglossi TaxID=1964448 RepID=UPI004041EDA5